MCQEGWKKEQAEQRLERAVSCAGEAFLIHFLGDILVSKSPDKYAAVNLKGRHGVGAQKSFVLWKFRRQSFLNCHLWLKPSCAQQQGGKNLTHVPGGHGHMGCAPQHSPS